MPTFNKQTKKIGEKLFLTDDGIQFDESILWLDSESNGQLSFLSSASSTKTRPGSQVIVSEETHKLLKLFNPNINALVCQYNRPFSIGRYELELVPSGSSLGASSLYIDTGLEKILYAPSVLDGKTTFARGFQNKEVDYLILKIDHCDPVKSFFASRNKEIQRLLDALTLAHENNKTPVIFTPPFHTATELSSLLSGKGFEVHTHKLISSINKIYTQFGHEVGDFKAFKAKEPLSNKAVVLAPNTARARKLFSTQEPYSFLFVYDHSEIDRTTNYIDSFDIPLPERGGNLAKIVQSIAPKKTFVYGPYASRFKSQHRSLSPQLELLHPLHQVSLL